MVRADGRTYHSFANNNNGTELTPGWYDFRHMDEEFLAVANWSIQ